MALLFSKVSLFNGESEAEFLTMGIPRDYEDLEGYTAFAEYVGELSDECDIEVNVESYLYGDDETVKASYEAIKLTAINKEDGQIDSTVLDFKDFFRSRPGSTAGSYTPHIWTYNEKSEWYGTSPSYSEKEAIGEAASEYVRLFTPEQEESNSMNMTL